LDPTGVGSTTKSWQILILRTEAVGHPGPRAGESRPDLPGIHLKHGSRVIVRIRVAGFDKRNVVHVRGQLGIGIAHPSPALSVLFEPEWRLHERAGPSEKCFDFYRRLGLPCERAAEFRSILVCPAEWEWSRSLP